MLCIWCKKGSGKMVDCVEQIFCNGGRESVGMTMKIGVCTCEPQTQVTAVFISLWIFASRIFHFHMEKIEKKRGVFKKSNLFEGEGLHFCICCKAGFFLWGPSTSLSKTKMFHHRYSVRKKRFCQGWFMLHFLSTKNQYWRDFDVMPVAHEKMISRFKTQLKAMKRP